MTRFALSPAAVVDLAEIWDYTVERWGPDQADAYVRDIQRAIERAAANPRVGKPCDEVRSGYLKLATGSHVIFYRNETHRAIDVVRILHQRMDIDRHL